MKALCKPWEHALSRRRFLGASGGLFTCGALGGLVSARAAEEMRKQEKQVLFIWLDGGISQLEELKSFRCDRQLFSARFSPCGAFLASGSMDRVVMRWRVEGDELIPISPLSGGAGWVQSIAFHPTERRLFVSDSWGRLACAPYEGGAPAVMWEHAAAHDGGVRRVAVSAEGELLATCGCDGFVRIWKCADGTPVTRYKHTSDVCAVTFTPDGRQIVFGDMYGRLFAYDYAAGKVVREFDAAPFYKLSGLQDVAGLRTLTFSEDGQTLVAGGCQPEGGGFLEGAPLLLQFEFSTGELLRETRPGGAKDGFIHDVVQHPNGFLMAVTSGQPGSGNLHFLRPQDAEPFFTNAEMPNCHSLALHPDGRRLVVTSTNRDSNGNGRLSTQDGQYPSNTSPVHLFRTFIRGLTRLSRGKLG